MVMVKPSDLDRLSGGHARVVLPRLLHRVTALVSSVAKGEGWPLSRVQVDLYQDPEVVYWEYLVVMLVFDSPFSQADQYLKQLYPHLDVFSHDLTEPELDMWRRLIYFDVASA